MFSTKRPQKLTKSSPSNWHYVVSVKSAVKISSIFVTFLDNMNIKYSAWKRKILVDCNASQHRVPFVQVLTSWVKVRFSCLIVTPSPYKTTDLSNLDTRMLSMCVCVLWEQKIKPFLKSGPQTHFLRSFKWDLSKIWHIYLLQGKIQKVRGTVTGEIIPNLFEIAKF